MLSVSGLSIYPVKSCGGFELDVMDLDRCGPVGDRRWMVVDAGGRFLTQREHASMALIRTALADGALHLASGAQSLTVEEPGSGARELQVQVWGDSVRALDAGGEAAAWLSAVLAVECRLVFMGDDSMRYVDGLYATEGQTVSFADGFPLLLISQGSLDDLNARLDTPVPMNRFRPNLVVSGCDPFEEDSWKTLRVGDLVLDVAKPCARCVMPSIDQHSGEKDSSILRTLASYRRGTDRQTYFGQNLLYRPPGRLALGDRVEILQRR